MYKLKVKDSVYTIPKQNIKAFALYQAIARGITHGDICDEVTAIKYLSSIGFEVSDGKE